MFVHALWNTGRLSNIWMVKLYKETVLYFWLPRAICVLVSLYTLCALFTQVMTTLHRVWRHHIATITTQPHDRESRIWFSNHFALVRMQGATQWRKEGENSYQEMQRMSIISKTLLISSTPLMLLRPSHEQIW
jgi:hypothetical protein